MQRYLGRILRVQIGRLASVYLAGVISCHSATGDVLVSLVPSGDAGDSPSDATPEAIVVGCVTDIHTLAVHAQVRLGAAAGSSGRNVVVFQDGNDTRLTTFDDQGALMGTERLLASDLTMDAPRIAFGEGDRLRIAFQDHRFAGKWRVYTQTIDSPGSIDAQADDGIQVSSDDSLESLAPQIVSRASEYGLLYRADNSVAFARIGSAGEVASRQLLVDQMPPPGILGVRSTIDGYLAIALRADYELEWFAADGTYSTPGPRIAATALDALWVGDRAVIVELQDGTFSLADLMPGAADVAAPQPWMVGPANGSVPDPSGFETARVGSDIGVAWREGDAHGGSLRFAWAPNGSMSTELSTSAVDGPKLIASGNGIWVVWVEADGSNQAMRIARACN